MHLYRRICASCNLLGKVGLSDKTDAALATTSLLHRADGLQGGPSVDRVCVRPQEQSLVPLPG
jgi:hypothetical protein